METSVKSRSYSYSVFSFVLDEMKGTSLPVGVALWGSEPGSVWVRLIGEREKIRGLNAGAYFQIAGVSQELSRWIQKAELPYGREEMVPHSDPWWKHVAKLLVHQVRASAPRPIDCISPSEEVDSLFEAVVAPRKPLRDRVERIDRALTQCLGALNRKLDRGTVSGYKGREVEVHRFKTSNDRLLVVDGVNLASVDAEAEVDALVSKLLRIRAADPSNERRRSVKVCVGYLASPHGLNGEATLVDWIQETAVAETFDLVRQGHLFYDVVDNELSTISDQPRL